MLMQLLDAKWRIEARVRSAEAAEAHAGVCVGEDAGVELGAEGR